MKACSQDAVLVVDDEPNVNRMFSFILRSSFPSLTVETAENGEEAVTLFLKKHHAVIFMDLRMPIMNGEEAFYKIQEECEARDWEMPSVNFCTGFIPPDTLTQIDGFGERHTLVQKPVTSQHFIDVVEKHLGIKAQ